MTDNKLQKKVKNEVAKDFRKAITELEKIKINANNIFLINFYNPLLILNYYYFK